jgi:isoquinoline 1-oxidoreductase beta subunit
MVLHAKLARREFLKTSTRIAGALVLGFYFPTHGQAQERAPGAALRIFKPNAWLRITADNRITVLVEKPELGQGSRTYTPIMIAEELEVDWSAIHVEQAPTIPSIYQGLRTGGSGAWQVRLPRCAKWEPRHAKCLLRLRPSNGKQRTETAERKTAP